MAQQLSESRQLDILGAEGLAGPQRPVRGQSPVRSRVCLMPHDLPGTAYVRIGPGARSRQSTALSQRSRPPLTSASEPDLRGVPA
jgi:hypothetical protein